jgi:hypothetical protein
MEAQAHRLLTVVLVVVVTLNCCDGVEYNNGELRTSYSVSDGWINECGALVE